MCAVLCCAGHGSTGDLQKYNVPHLPFLTPPHLRKGKGGRQPASDPRLVGQPARLVCRPPGRTAQHYPVVVVCCCGCCCSAEQSFRLIKY
jgi:hypothetical protein